jgi:hypothetical protein
MDIKEFFKPTKIKIGLFVFCAVFLLIVFLGGPMWSPGFSAFQLAVISFLGFGVVTTITLLAIIFPGAGTSYGLIVPLLVVNAIYLYFLACLVSLIQNKTMEKTRVPFSLIFVIMLLVLFVIDSLSLL